MNRVIKGLLALALTMGLSQVAKAVPTGQLTVTITPNALYSLTIDTANVSLNMGNVDLNVSTQTVSPSTVTIDSTYATTEIELQGASAGSGTPWTFDADTSNDELDALKAWGVFTTVSRTSAPTQTSGYFSGTVPGNANSDVMDTTNRGIGDANSLFEAGGADFAFKDMDDLPSDPNPLAKSHLWLYFTTPVSSTDNNAKLITITLTASAPN